MDKAEWKIAETLRLLNMPTSQRQLLVDAERAGNIPKAKRVMRGRLPVRYWDVSQVIEIGRRYGYLKCPQKTVVVSVYTAKGGVLKSTITFNMARMLALHGIRTLVIGLDVQGSITELLAPPRDDLTLEGFTPAKGLYHLHAGVEKLDDIILKTDLPTLDLIPESASLGKLEKALFMRAARELFLRDAVVDPLRKRYDVVLFDNSPNWNLLIENSLAAADVIVSPIGCDPGSYEALDTNREMTEAFSESLKLRWKDQILVPTLLEKNKTSAHVYGLYLSKFSSAVTHHAIRRAAGGMEAHAYRKSAIEYAPKSDLGQDYAGLISEIWDRVIKTVS